MVDWLQILLGLLFSYLLGSIPSSVWVGKIFYNKDVRDYGSGNAGATNTIRVLGWKAGIPVLLFDIAKGWFPVFASMHMLMWNMDPESLIYVHIGFGLASVLGHVYPIYIGFRGGKGVGTLAGMALGLFPLAFISSLIIFIIVVGISKYVSLGSISAGIAFPIFLIFVFDIQSIPSIILGFIAAFFIIYTHRKNIKALLSGTENKFKFKKS